MKWVKQGRGQVLVANGYIVEITKSREVYWATCFKQEDGYKIKKFTFPCRRSLRDLKEIVENNDLFIDIVTVVKKPLMPQHAEVVTEQWWQKI